MTDQKRCAHCHEYKPLSQFHTLRDGRYVQSWCRTCKAESMRQSRAARKGEPKVRLWRPAFGEKSHKAKLTDSDVRLIRGLLGELPCAVIARKFDVSRQTISGIKHGHKWTHVQE